jgi:hypothetical protein
MSKNNIDLEMSDDSEEDEVLNVYKCLVKVIID